jgi:hypothetical protein
MTERTAPADGAASGPAPVGPVMAGAPGPAPASRPASGIRWAIALLVVAVVVGIAAAGAYLLGGTVPSRVLGYVPPGTVAYLELRLDLPGDQREQLGRFLSRFPGFDDTALLERKLAEVYDRIVRAATNDRHDYSSEIEPWFGGEVAVAVGGLPDVPDATPLKALLLVSVTDGAAASAWVDRLVGDAPTSGETHNGVELTLIGQPGQTRAAAAVTGGVLLIGDADAVRASIDTGGRSSFATTEGVTAGRAGLGGDRLGMVYVDLKSVVDWATSVGSELSPGAETLGRSMLDRVPSWVTFGIGASDGTMVGTVLAPHVDAPGLTNASSALLERIPASALLVVDQHEVGKIVLDALDSVRALPAAADAMRQVDEAAGLLGGLDRLLGWIGEVAVVVDSDGSSVSGGVLVRASDPIAMAGLLAAARGFIALGGASALTVREESHAGTTITIVDVPAGLAPGRDAAPTSAGFSVAYANTGDMLIVGASDGFVRRILDTTPEDSLVRRERFTRLLDQAGPKHTSLLWLDLTAVRGSLEESLVDPAAKSRYERDLRSYLEPLDAFIGATVVGDDLDRFNSILTVR